MCVLDLPRQFFMVRYDAEDDYMAAMTSGPWRVFGSILMVQAWSPTFNLVCEEIVTTPVWVRIAHIPISFYHETILMGIAERVGKPLKVDLTTLKMERASFAHVCVEVDLSKPLKGTVVVNDERAPSQRSTEEGQGQQKEVNKTDGLTKDLGGEPSRPLVENAHISGTATVGVANRFSGLQMNEAQAGERDIMVESEANKENVDCQNVVRFGDGRSQTEKKVNDLGKSQGEVLEQRMRGNRTWRNVRHKGKQLEPHAPVRGLIFGPIRGKMGSTASGKRLLVENESVGQKGGVYILESGKDGAERRPL
ncbi:uncharacterized protein LOC17878355 [Capsella rubella]|uniref:uncharacterized protein LOC17878355 n=1 Tax=Capsella rubella TaxID=81985 RepID=UPI000CD4A6A0|nr:uncharacterized protein LOC17878355 [Capsella rubella]